MRTTTPFISIDCSGDCAAVRDNVLAAVVEEAGLEVSYPSSEKHLRVVVCGVGTL